MTAPVQPKAYKRYCPQGHDTWICGRSGSHHCKKCQRKKNREVTEQERLLKSATKPEYVPGLRALRKDRGYTLRQLAWESGLDHALIHRIELLKTRATYAQRVKIFQALNILRSREIEAREAEIEKGRKLAWAGLR